MTATPAKPTHDLGLVPGADLPELDLEHLRLMTDATGMLQHAVFSVPRYEDGYCLDDTASGTKLRTNPFP